MDRPGGVKLDAVQRFEHAIGKMYKRRKVPLEPSEKSICR